jgi:hypothetical protein
VSRVPGTAIDEQRLTRYLLGLLPQVENQRLDEACIVDDEMAAALRIVEDDLVDAYLGGQLPADLREPFEAHYLSSARRRGQVRFEQKFLDAVDRAATPPRERERAPGSRRPMPRVRRVTAIAAVAAALIVAFGAALFEAGKSRQGAHRTETTIETASAAVPVLLPQTRAVDLVPVIVVPAAADTLAVRLRLESNDFQRYSVTLTDLLSNRIEWRGEAAVEPRDEQLPSIAVTIPARRLKSQHYTFALSGQRGGRSEVIASYTFQVARR